MGFLKRRIKGLQAQDPARIGSIPGVKLFARYQSREELYIAGVHGKHEGGIHGRAGAGAFSVIVAGRYEDDVDHGDIILYTGEGGHSRQSEMQFQDQDWVRGNAALKRSCHTREPVRVVRSSILRSKYAPASGYRYDGLYRVTSAEQVIGKNGHAVCQFVLERLPGQAPLPGSPGAAEGSSQGQFAEDNEEEERLPSPVAGSSRPPALVALKRRAPKKSKTSDSGDIQFKFEGSNSPAKPTQQEVGSSRPAIPPPGFR